MQLSRYVKSISGISLIPAIFFIIKLLLPLFIHPDFELHRDEYLYLAMADHLSWGYLEVPPAISILAWIAKYILGGGIYAVRFLPALSGALTIYFTIRITNEFGGGRLAQLLTACCYVLSVAFLRINILFQPVTFNLLFYVLAIYLFIRILKAEKPLYWILLGVVIGFGILIKYTILLLPFGIFIALILTPYRRLFLNKWLWISGAIALIIWLPNLVWQHIQNWPFFEHMRVLSERQLENIQAHIFVLVQLLMNLHALPVWLTGLFVFQFSKKYTQYRPVTIIYFSSLIILMMLSGKTYYLAPAYPMLFAAGSVVIEKYFQTHTKRWPKILLIIFILYNGIVMLPIGIPILSVKSMIGYFRFTSQYMGTGEALRWEDGKIHALPQDYADMIGWEDMCKQVAEVFHQLPPEDKKICAIFAANYGEAGAIDYYGHKYNLPRSISKGSSYWLWGFREYDGRVAIIMGLSPEIVTSFYHEISYSFDYKHAYARENGMQIIVARHPKISMAELWQYLKQYRY